MKRSKWLPRDYLLAEFGARRDLNRWVVTHSSIYNDGGSVADTCLAQIRGRIYDLGYGTELLTPPGFRAAVRRLAVMRMAKAQGLKIPNDQPDEIVEAVELPANETPMGWRNTALAIAMGLPTTDGD